MKDKNRIIGYKEGTSDWNAEYNMLLDERITCNDCAHCETCCSSYGQRPYINDGRCQWYPNRFEKFQKRQ